MKTILAHLRKICICSCIFMRSNPTVYCLVYWLLPKSCTSHLLAN